jgi:hypothetical protein
LGSIEDGSGGSFTAIALDLNEITGFNELFRNSIIFPAHRERGLPQRYLTLAGKSSALCFEFLFGKSVMNGDQRIVKLLERIEPEMDRAEQLILSGNEREYFAWPNAINLSDAYEDIFPYLDLGAPACFLLTPTNCVWEADTNLCLVLDMLHSDLTDPDPLKFVWDARYGVLRKCAGSELAAARRKCCSKSS